MSMGIDKARCDPQAIGIDHASGKAAIEWLNTDLGDTSVVDGDIGYL